MIVVKDKMPISLLYDINIVKDNMYKINNVYLNIMVYLKREDFVPHNPRLPNHCKCFVTLWSVRGQNVDIVCGPILFFFNVC